MNPVWVSAHHHMALAVHPEKKSGSSGSRFQHRYILGYRCGMSDDRSCSGNQYYEKSFDRHGKYH